MNPDRGSGSRSWRQNDLEISDTESEDSDIEYIPPPPPPMIDLTNYGNVFTPQVKQRIHQMSREIIDLTEAESRQNNVRSEQVQLNTIQMLSSLLQGLFRTSNKDNNVNTRQPVIIEISDNSDTGDSDTGDSDTGDSDNDEACRERSSPPRISNPNPTEPLSNLMGEVINQLKDLQFDKVNKSN